MKNFKRIICLIISALFVFQLAACSKDTKEPAEKKESKKSETKVSETSGYSPDWLLSPSIKADSIFSMPIVDFNDSTNHYDVTFGKYYGIKKGDKYGLIDSSGKIIFEPQFDSLETCHCYKGYIATVKESEYYTITYHISLNGDKIVANTHTCKGFSGNEYVWNDGGGYAYSVNVTGDVRVTSSISPYMPETMRVFDGKDVTEIYVLFNQYQPVSSTRYTGAGVFTGGVAALKQNGKWGYLNSKGSEILPFEFDAIEGYNALHYETPTPYECSEGYITVLKDGKYGIYSSDGQKIVPCELPYLTTVHDGRAFASQDGKTWGIICVDSVISGNADKPEEPTEKAEETTSSAVSTTAAQTTTTTAAQNYATYY